MVFARGVAVTVMKKLAESSGRAKKGRKEGRKEGESRGKEAKAEGRCQALSGWRCCLVCLWSIISFEY
jgi:hypothetical protein